jgi:hypothetical protein
MLIKGTKPSFASTHWSIAGMRYGQAMRSGPWLADFLTYIRCGLPTVCSWLLPWYGAQSVQPEKCSSAEISGWGMQPNHQAFIGIGSPQRPDVRRGS